MARITEQNYLSLVIDNLRLLLQLADDKVIPSMIYDGDVEELAADIAALIRYLNKTN